MPATFIGVRHHSPACARLVGATIADLRPAFVLVEGPADMNERMGELLLGHDLPIAVFSSYRDDERHAGSWAPFCEYSPEWVALRAGRDAGADVRFIDLPAWHEALAGRENRYSDADERYAEAVDRLCAAFTVDNVDTLWDHLFEIDPLSFHGPAAATDRAASDDCTGAAATNVAGTGGAGGAAGGGGDRSGGIVERLAAYFDLLRGESEASDEDQVREEYMARWVRAAVREAGERPVVVVTGGFHRPALIRLAAQDDGDAQWPPAPVLPPGAAGGSYLVPYSFRRLDAFDGYQSGMPSPEYYQRLWDSGPDRAADGLVAAVVERLRQRRQRASTADLIAARASAAGLAMVRGHRHPARTDILDGLAAALVHDALDEPLPWATRGRLRPGTHPVVAEMVAALSGDRVGRLHRATPLPPLVHAATADIEREGLAAGGSVALTLTGPDGLRRSRMLHRLRVLSIPGFARERGPATGIDPVLDEQWTVDDHEHRLPALIEAGAYGATLEQAAAAAIAERAAKAGGNVGALADALFDAALCGTTRLSERVLRDLALGIAAAPDLGELGRLLGTLLALWRHDRLLGTAGSEVLGAIIGASHDRLLWLAEGARGATVAADPDRIGAIVALRDAVVHAGPALGLDRAAALGVTARIAAAPAAPPDLRGAAFGFGWSLGAQSDPLRAVRGAGGPVALGDWLSGLFALAREEVLHTAEVLDLLDELIRDLGPDDFLIALPALRQAFAYFPPRERETIAGHVLARHGHKGSGRALLRAPAADPALLARAAALEGRVDAALTRQGLRP